MNDTIPVYCQYPNRPKGRRLMGTAYPHQTYREVASEVGLPVKEVINGSVTKGKSGRYWLLITLAFGDEVHGNQ